MASDLSSGCTDAIEVLDEREEGEISLEDVSSSEEGHISYGYGTRSTRCVNCLSTQHCALWCTSSTRYYHHKNSNTKDAVQEKENHHYAKDSGSMGIKHAVSTLQEKNDDLVPISSDSDMEIVGLADNSKHIVIRSLSRSRSKKKKKKKRLHAPTLSTDDFVSSSSIDLTVAESTLKHDNDIAKGDRVPRSHHRESSPSHRNIKSRGIAKSPFRKHRTTIWMQSPLRKSRSSVMRARSPILRRSPCRLRSPKRSPCRWTRIVPKKISKSEQEPSLNTNTDAYGSVAKLLKKVRNLDSVGIHAQEESIRNREHSSSLKEKLSNMMKGISDNNGNVTNCTKEKAIAHVETNNDADDEDDLALLRQKALETKQKRVDKNNQQTKSEPEIKTTTYNVDDEQEEDLELRMLALRSAVMKKHQNQVQRGVKPRKYDTSTVSRSESPFTQSFLDSIPIPSEKHDSPAPIYTSASRENIHMEDMELDSDVEREKEKLPYSPTDNITIDIPIDTELLGIQSSDVSFINLNKRVSSPPFDNANTQLEHKTLRTGIIENKSYLPNVMNCASTESMFYETNADAPYSPSDSIETSKSDIAIGKHCGTPISNASQFSNSHCSMITSMDISMGQERPYSPTDAPIYDPDLSQTLPLIQSLHSSSNFSIMPLEAIYDTSYGNITVPNIHENSRLEYPAQQANMSENKQVDEAENIIPRKQTDSPRFSEAGSISPNDSMMTIDDFLDTEMIDPCPSGSASRNSENVEPIPSNSIHKPVEEPLYMQGIPDVIKDINKIPTLINRTLVPAPILKSNKQLQQPLPAKKHENQTEPTFKSAEMQPVSIDFNINTKSNTQFKPMKLASITKKPQTILTMPTAFQGCLNDDATNKILEDTATSPFKEVHDITSLKNNSTNSEKAVAINSTDIVPKKKKRTRRNGRRNNNNTIQIINNRISNKSIEESKHDSSTLESGETSASVTRVSAESRCSDIHERQDNITNTVGSLDSNNAKVIQNENSIKNNIPVPANEIQKSDTAQNPTNVKTHTNSCSKVVDKKEPINRRPSLDEDEEALRAILLASLAKRTKSSDISSNNTSPVTTTAPLSNVSTVQSTQKAQVSTAIPTQSVHQTVQNDAKLHTSVQSVLPHNLGDEKNHAYSTPVSSASVTKEHAVGISIDAASSLPLINTRKRTLPMPKGPSRKFVKKVLIPASTKVVNNAKKYQNTVVQRKLILQKAASIYNAEKLKDNKTTVSNTKTCENKWSSNTKAISSETQRIVINLESDTESDSEHERLKAKSISLANSKKIEKRPVITVPTNDFEKSVVQFLRDARKKQETAAATKRTVSSHNVIKKNLASVSSVENKTFTTVHTPLAVRHLPVSKQEEYRRLKQQILERERLKLQRSVESGSSKKASPSITSHSTKSDNLSKESSKEDQNNTLTKVQSLNSQTSIKNSNDKSNETKKNVNMLKSSVVSISADKDLASNNISKQRNTMPHIKVRIANEIAPNQNNTKGNTTECNVTSLDAKSMLQNTSLQETRKSSKSDATLRLLTKDDLNHIFVQIQMKQNEPGRIVTINNRTNLSEKTDLGYCIKHEEEKDKNEMNGRKEDNIPIKDEEDQSKRQSECHKSDSSNINIISAEDTDEEVIMQEDVVSDDRNNLKGSNVNLVTEETNVQNVEEKEEDQPLFVSIENCTDDCTISNTSSVETDRANNSNITSNNIEENKVINAEELWESINKDIKTEFNSLIYLSRVEQERHLMDTEQQLIMKRYTVLDDLAEMSGDLRQWDTERDMQTNLVEEVKKLREQLKVAEEKLRIHRNRVNSIGPKVMAAHEKVNNGRRECVKLSRICMVLGTKVVGEDYKVPQAGANLLENKLKEVANHTRQLSKKKVPSVHISENYTLLEKTITLPKQIEIVRESPQKEILPIRKEVINFEHSVKMEEDNDHNENNNTIALKSENVLSLTNAETSSEFEEDKVKKEDSFEAREIAKEEEDYCCERTLEAESCGSSSRLQQDCDINQCTEATSKVLRDVDHPKKIKIEPYVSMLTHLKIKRNTNPNGVLCPYELMGTCNDGDCQFVHQSTGQVL